MLILGMVNNIMIMDYKERNDVTVPILDSLMREKVGPLKYYKYIPVYKKLQLDGTKKNNEVKT